MSKDTHPGDFILPELAKPKRLPIGPGPRLLLQRLGRLPSWSQQGFAFCSQGWLASELGVCVRTIFNWQKKLVSAGLLSVDGADGQRNHYRPGREDDSPASAKGADAPGKSCRGPRKELPGTSAKVAGVFTEMNKEESKDKLDSSSKRPAAAAPEGRSSLLVRELSALGLSIGLANRLVRQDPQLAEVGLPMLRAKILSGEARDPPGFIVGFFKNPEAYNFSKSVDGWSAPIASVKKSGNILNGRKLRRYRPPEGN